MRDAVLLTVSSLCSHLPCVDRGRAGAQKGTRLRNAAKPKELRHTRRALGTGFDAPDKLMSSVQLDSLAPFLIPLLHTCDRQKQDVSQRFFLQRRGVERTEEVSGHRRSSSAPVAFSVCVVVLVLFVQ